MSGGADWLAPLHGVVQCPIQDRRRNFLLQLRRHITNRFQQSVQVKARFGGRKNHRRVIEEKQFFLDYAPVIFTSAKSGFHLERLLEAVRYVASQLQQKIPTSILNRTLHDAVERRQPISSAGHRLKFFYATQVRQAPPTFLLFVNRDELFSEPYKKYLAGEMRKAFGYEGCPIVLAPKARPKTIEPVRAPRRPGPKDEQVKRRGRGGSRERLRNRSR